MNWYKEAQSEPTMKDIIWAIDKLIAENYDFSVEELSQGQDEMPVAKAAQVSTTNRDPGSSYPIPDNETDRMVVDLFSRGYSTSSIRKRTGIPSPSISKILNKYFSNKQEQLDWLKREHEGNILDEAENQIGNMKQDYNILGIGPKDIARVLELDVSFVRRALWKNNVDLGSLKAERRDSMAEDIRIIANDLDGVFTTPEIQKEFYNRHGHKLKSSSAQAAITLLNLGNKRQNDSASIFKAFTTFVWRMYRGGIHWFEQHPELLPPSVDRFFNTYGQYHIDQKKSLIDWVMAKIQVRDRTLDNIKDPKNPGKHDPLVTDDSQPSYFLGNRGQEQNQNYPQLAESNMNWYKKANKWKDQIPGGRADYKKPADYDPRSVEKGKEIEKEHTNNPSKAKEIAIDHLEELPDYYDEKKGLPAMERKLEKKKPATDRRGRYDGGLQRISI